MRAVRDSGSMSLSSGARRGSSRLPLNRGGREASGGCAMRRRLILGKDLAQHGPDWAAWRAARMLGLGGAGVDLRHPSGHIALADRASADAFVAAGDDVPGCHHWPNVFGPHGVANDRRVSALRSVSFLSTFQPSSAQSAGVMCDAGTATSDTGGRHGLRVHLDLAQCLVHQPVALNASPMVAGRRWPGQRRIQSRLHPERGARGHGCASGIDVTGLARRDRNCRPALRLGECSARLRGIAGCLTHPWGSMNYRGPNPNRKEKTHGT